MVKSAIEKIREENLAKAKRTKFWTAIITLVVVLALGSFGIWFVVILCKALLKMGA